MKYITLIFALLVWNCKDTKELSIQIKPGATLAQIYTKMSHRAIMCTSKYQNKIITAFVANYNFHNMITQFYFENKKLVRYSSFSTTYIPDGREICKIKPDKK